jgi:hypothetical protein
MNRIKASLLDVFHKKKTHGLRRGPISTAAVRLIFRALVYLG